MRLAKVRLGLEEDIHHTVAPVGESGQRVSRACWSSSVFHAPGDNRHTVAAEESVAHSRYKAVVERGGLEVDNRHTVVACSKSQLRNVAANQRNLRRVLLRRISLRLAIVLRRRNSIAPSMVRLATLKILSWIVRHGIVQQYAEAGTLEYDSRRKGGCLVGSVTGIAEVCRVYGEYMAGMRIDARWNRIVVGS